MLTTTCTIFRDGRCATARVSTASPQQEGEVHYDGELDLFPHRFVHLANADLRLIARDLVGQAGMTVRIEDDGKYDYWAE